MAKPRSPLPLWYWWLWKRNLLSWKSGNDSKERVTQRRNQEQEANFYDSFQEAFFRLKSWFENEKRLIEILTLSKRGLMKRTGQIGLSISKSASLPRGSCLQRRIKMSRAAPSCWMDIWDGIESEDSIYNRWGNSKCLRRSRERKACSHKRKEA